ncbi:DUF4062 domain-containing protein [Novosphingobium sp. KN65.2]|uniref:DUF4062 domain-containing protein n=1 Tax=Novosphingobium sp. KN65.2 TaxID=1478134 RepID=UPI0005E215C5|nr:DUF4062 domain-containing protein [Novosphingobium sp. KN65.2]CDO34968.1 hypothetical protein SPHV1_2170041 [Novosphingobium sp. KN65.2]
MDVKLIRAFIASPGGLEQERKAAFAAAKEINKSVAMPMGGRLELIGWEDTLSGNGRPQATINAEMETCDLFIGAIWSSWGSNPSLDGPYTSGFEEEFERSRERHGQTGSPLMAMFFKNVEANQLRDPGQDLKKVLAFQEKLKAEKNFLYGTFAEADEFAAKVREFLATHVLAILRQPDAVREERPTAIERQPAEAGTMPVDHGNGDFPDAQFLNAAASGLQSETGLGPLDIARMRLIAGTYGKSQNDKQTLGVHDANLLYAQKKQLKFSAMEKLGLLEAGLSYLRDQNVPIWSWLKDISDGRDNLLTRISLSSEPAERAGAIEAMRLLQEPVVPLSSDDEIVDDHWLGLGKPTDVKIAALRYLRDLGTLEHLPAVQREIAHADRDTLTPATETAVRMLLRSSGQDAVRFILNTSFETLDVDVLNQALSHVRLASVQELEAGLDHRAPQVRAASLNELSERDAVDLAILERAKIDAAATVRYAALRALDRLGQSASLNEAEKILCTSRGASGAFGLLARQDSSGVALFEIYAADRMRSMQQGSLEALLGPGTNGFIAYCTLAARRMGDYPTDLRADLLDGFKSYVARTWPDGIKPAPDTLGLLSLTIGKSDPVETKKRDLIGKALDVISRKLDHVDLALVRAVLDESRIGPSETVLAYFKAFGQEEDVARLAQTSMIRVNIPDNGGYFRDFAEAARLILKLHQGSPADLLAFDMPRRMKAQVIEVMTAKDFAAMSDPQILALLLSEDDEVRRQAARKTPMSLSRTRIARILEAYDADPEGRYYIVTHWLDLGLAFERAAARRVATADR